MKPTTIFRTTLLASALLGLSAPGFALGYGELVQAAQGQDRELELLGIEEERALIAMRKAELDLDSPALSLSTGGLSLGLPSGAFAASASPQASLTLPGGTGLELSAPFSLAPSSATGYAAPALSLSIPLIKRGDEKAVAAARAQASYESARYAHLKRRVEVEKAVAEALRDAAKAEAEAGTARRKVEVAALALEKAVRIDGAEKGGKAWLSLERERKSAERSLRDAEATRSRGLEKLAMISGLEPGPDLIPTELPESRLDASLPAAESLAAARSAATDLANARLAAGEAAKDKALALKLGANYATQSIPSSVASNAGAELDAGLAWANEELSLSFGLGWRPDLGDNSKPGPTASFSLGWKPRAKGSAGLEARDRTLSVAEAEAKAKAALEASRSALRGLEYRRKDLEAAALDLEEDLAAAREELAVYEAWRAKGAVTEAEYREVLAFASEAESRARVAAAERIIWKLDLELLGAGPEGNGQGRTAK